MSSPERDPIPTVKTLTPSFDASSAMASGSLSVSSPSVRSRMTCAREGPALGAQARQELERRVHGLADGRAADGHVPREEVPPESFTAA